MEPSQVVRQSAQPDEVCWVKVLTEMIFTDKVKISGPVIQLSPLVSEQGKLEVQS